MVASSAIVLALLVFGQAGEGLSQTQVQVRLLVRGLDSDELARREAAERALIALGPEALEHLPRPTATTSAEARQRLARIRDALQRQWAESAAKASRVTLTLDQTPLSEALAAIERQTGNRILDFRGRFGQVRSDPPLTAEWDEAPFWEALDQILDVAGLGAYHYTGEAGALAIVAAAPGALPRSAHVSYSEVLRIAAQEITAVRNLRQEGNDTLRLKLEVAWEPRLRLISIEQPLAEVAAVDEQGNPIPLAQTAGTLEVPVRPGVSGAEIQIPFALPQRSVQKIASLRGTMTALMPGRVESFEFDGLAAARNVEQRSGAAAVILQGVRKNVDAHEVRVLVRFDEAANALESHRGWILENEAYLVSAGGKRIDYAALEETGRSANEAGLAFMFALEEDIAGMRFVYRTPAAILKLPLPYELTDLALP